MDTHPLQKLADAAVYMRILAVILYLVGIVTTLTIVGILWSWVYFWMGSLLWLSASSLEKGVADQDEASIAIGCKQIFNCFKLMAILALISIVITIVWIAYVIINLSSTLSS